MATKVSINYHRKNACMNQIKNNEIIFILQYNLEIWRDKSSKKENYAAKNSVNIWNVNIDNKVISGYSDED